VIDWRSIFKETVQRQLLVHELFASLERLLKVVARVPIDMIRFVWPRVEVASDDLCDFCSRRDAMGPQYPVQRLGGSIG
jgi:hypothetical protein